tara:strand:+ start:172858 stop:172977 length:120 start_codon:yes stop_codon:yes gene_type:complete
VAEATGMVNKTPIDFGGIVAEKKETILTKSLLIIVSSLN